MKKIVLGISGGVSLLVFLILLFITNLYCHKQLSQQVAERWNSEGGTSQVSCFFSVNSGISEEQIIEFEHTIDSALADASVLPDPEKVGARLWADTYSASGRITLTTDRASLSADAIGFGGDFFLFHPETLLYGSYFSGNDLMKDYCVIDEDAAWQLFGSSNVAGMMVSIGGKPHVVSGVIHREEGRLAEAAGLENTLVYVSYQTLEELGRSNGINHYEIVMPNPVSDFAYDYIKKQLGSDEENVEVVENSSRYSLLSRLKLLGQFGLRSMNGKAIIYPHWENIARGYEDLLALLTLLMLVFLAYPVLLALIWFCSWWRHKGWTLRSVRLWLQDKAERKVEKLREKRKNLKGNGEIREEKKRRRKKSEGDVWN